MENKEYTLVVKNLPDNVDEGILLSIFSTKAKIRSLRIMKDSKTKKSRGFAYINFFNENSLTMAYKNFKNYELMGKKLEFVLKNEIDELERDLNILISDIESQDKDLVLQILGNYGEVFSHKFEEDKEKLNFLRCYVQYRDINSAFNCINNLEKINNKIVNTRFKSDNIIGIKVNYNRTFNNAQKILKDFLSELKIKFNFSKEKMINQLFNSSNIFFSNSYDSIFFFYNDKFQNLIKNNIIFASFIKINKKKKLTVKLKNFKMDYDINSLKESIKIFGEIEQFEEKEDYILIQLLDNLNMIELIEDLERKNNFAETLGSNFVVLYNKILYKTIKKTMENIENKESFYDLEYLENNFEEFSKFNKSKKNLIWKNLLEKSLKEYLNSQEKYEFIKYIEKMIDEMLELVDDDTELLNTLKDETEKDEIFNILIQNIMNA